MKKLLLLFTLFVSNIICAQNTVLVNGIAYELTTVHGNNNQSIAYVVSKDYYFDEPYTGKIVIPETIVYQNKQYPVVGLSRDAFENSQDLVSVVLPKRIKTISGGAFRNCKKLSLDFLDGIRKIGSMAFYDCAFTSVTIPNSVTTIEEAAFEDCELLEHISISQSVTDIEGSTFRGCVKLRSIDLPEGLQRIREALFSNCKSLNEIIIPSNVKGIDIRAFKNCSNLASIVIPDNVTEIGMNVFEGCTKLKSVYMGSKIKTIGTNVFSGCSNLRDIYFNTLTCPSMPIYAFQGLPFDQITLHVPDAAVETFKGMIPWNKFKIVGDPDMKGKPDVDTNKWEYRTTDRNDKCKIIKVETSETETKVYMAFETNTNRNCNISPNTVIEANGVKYKIKDAVSITFAPTNTVFYPGITNFTLIFPPIPADVTIFNLIESEDSSWRFYEVKVIK